MHVDEAKHKYVPRRVHHMMHWNARVLESRYRYSGPKK